MFTQIPSVNEAALDEIINALLLELKDTALDAPEREAMTKHLSELYKLKTVESETDSRRRVSPDVIVSAIASLAGILTILGHERTHILTSKAISFVTRLR